MLCRPIESRTNAVFGARLPAVSPDGAIEAPFPCRTTDAAPCAAVSIMEFEPAAELSRVAEGCPAEDARDGLAMGVTGTSGTFGTAIGARRDGSFVGFVRGGDGGGGRTVPGAGVGGTGR